MTQEELSTSSAQKICDKMLANIHSVIYAQEDLITENFCAFLSGGHIPRDIYQNIYI